MEDLFKALESLKISAETRALLRELLPAPIPSLDIITKRLSLLRTFTQAAYEVTTEDLKSAPDFEAFTATGSIEPMIGHQGRFSVIDRVRTQNLHQWVKEVEERALWSRKLAVTLDLNDPVEQFDHLQILFLADQNDARRTLIDTFERADRDNNIAQCSALLQLVAHTVRLFGDNESNSLLNKLRARSQARNLFFTEFYQSERYHERPIHDTILKFARGSGDKWIFHLHATGGMGKTTLLRRVISHDLIVGTNHVPCAVLDFDYLEVSAVLQQPALLGLAMAAQWNEQLEQPVFGSMLMPSMQEHASLLFRSRTDGSARDLSSETLDQRSRTKYRAGRSNPMRCGILAGAVPPRTLKERTDLMQKTSILLSLWTDKLPEALASMPVDRPVLLVLDTLEDASQAHGQQLLEMLDLLANLRQQAHNVAARMDRPPVNLRVILSGRYELGKEHVPHFATHFGTQCHTQELPGLSATEARKFLVSEVNKTIDSKLVDAMVEKSAGIPFNLSLFAEWANADATLDVEVVKRSEDVSTVMLIERIIKRIPYQPLRWVIRYGTVPRSLSLNFLRDVMREPLLNALSGQAFESGADRAKQDIWQPEQNFIFDADALWSRHIRPYVKERSWIAPGETAAEVVFRADIRQPMRKLLSKQRIFAQLHERSRDWFAARTGTAAEIECLYHSAQLRAIDGCDGADLLPMLRKMLDAPSLVANARLRAAVCEELRKSDFSELTSRERAYVSYRLAEALAAENDYSFTTPEAVEYFHEAIELAGNQIDEVLPKFAAVWKLVTVDGTNLSVIFARTRELEESEDFVRASLLGSEMVPQSKQMQYLLSRAADLYTEGKWVSIPFGVVAARLANCIRSSNPEGAVLHFTQAADDYSARGDTTKQREFMREAGGIEIGLGHLRRAEELLHSNAERTSIEDQQLLARLELTRGNPGQALDLLRRGIGSPSADHSLESLLIQAEALTQRILVDEALDAWERASALASQQGDTVALARIAIGQAKLYCWWLRVWPETMPPPVQSLLRRAQSTTSVQDALTNELDIWQIVYAEPSPSRWRSRALGELGGHTPAACIRLILALSQVVTPFPAKRWEELIAHAKEIPLSARTAALAEPVLEGSPPELDPQVRDQLIEVFYCEPHDPIEKAWFAIRYGELLAWLGAHETAVKLLRSCVPILDTSAYGEGWKPAVYRQRRRIERRIREWRRMRGLKPFPPPDPDPPEIWATFWVHTPFRSAAALIENAQRALEAGNHSLMKDCLNRAERGLLSVHIETKFHALYRRLRSVLRKNDQVPIPEAVSRVEVARGPESLAGAATDEAIDFDVLDMHEQSGRIVVRTSSSARQQVISAVNPTLELLVRSRGIPRRLVGLPLDDIARDLEEFTSLCELRSRRTGLRVPLSPLCCVPWEMALRASPPSFRLPTAWSEAEAVSSSRRELPLDSEIQLESVLLLPLSPQDRESPAHHCYVALGSRIPQRLDTLRHKSQPPNILYVASSFIEIPNLNEPMIAGIEWTSTTLAHNLSRIFGDIQPFVVLDVPAPYTSADYVHQILLRNYFAQALLDTGVVHGVLATGLHPLEKMGHVQDFILRRISWPNTQIPELMEELVALLAMLDLPRHDALFTATPRGPLCVRRAYA